MYKLLFPILALSLLSLPALSQNSAEPENANLPVEATADDLQVNNESNSAVFTGNANVIQGVLNLQADKITVYFDENAKNIKTVDAVGRVNFTNGLETAEAQKANFDVASQTIVFVGNVILRQAQTVLTGDKLTHDIKTSRSKMSGNVKTIYTPN